MSSPRGHSYSLAALARALGGDVYAGGRRALLPAPGHSAGDRSISLWLTDGRVVVHSFGGGDWREALDVLRAGGWIDAENRLLASNGRAAPDRSHGPDPTRAARVAAAQRLWVAGGPVAAGSAAALHLARRGVDLGLAAGDALRAHAAAPATVYRGDGPFRPALLAAVLSDQGRLTAVEITYLDAQGRRCAAARPPRKVVGVLPPGCAVRLAPQAPDLLVGEGVFTTLSAMRRFALPGWALLSAVNLRRWRAPAGVRRVVIAGDRGRAGEEAARQLQAALRAEGVSADVVLPPVGVGDWNDLDQAEGGRKGG